MILGNQDYEYCRTRLVEISDILGGMNIAHRILEQDEAVLPSIIIGIPKRPQDEADRHVVLTILPLSINDNSALFAQFSIEILDKNKVEDADNLILEYNSGFIFGNLFIFNEKICLKYAVRFFTDDDIDAEAFGMTLDAFVWQSEICKDNMIKSL